MSGVFYRNVVIRSEADLEREFGAKRIAELRLQQFEDEMRDYQTALSLWYFTPPGTPFPVCPELPK